GVHSAELIGPTKALALYYQEHEDHALEIAALEQARQLVRVNYGLYSLEEVPLLQQWMRAERARGNDTGAWDVEQRLLKLVRRNANDLRTVPILRDVAERRLDILARYEGGEFPPEIDRKSTRLNSSHVKISYAVFCLKKKTSRQPWERY